ncbi:heme biosynthesis protein HemY [Amylibacter sp. SFDW26]|uniref:heme biosynthesis protein HemY n=1 Tax=Amylibacter sp. SFDW26 TaxID=2652722 RepID=UPI0012622590|nr:heme biosynthesis HemY N-terminal domain-containing protein [Amylibacter sp. SFDW26]KAB7614642.1 heme biosynthesis protein HemY [Amylibacter sp. SFDW26]
MIWSLVRIILFIGIIALITFGIVFVIETGGEVRLSLAEKEYSFSPLIGVIGLVLLLAALWVAKLALGLMSAVFHFFNGDETAITRYFNRNREKKGFDALAEGMVALAAGEGKTAMAQVSKAERMLQRPELTNLVNAQAAEMSGDTKKALKYYKSLLENDRTRFVGVRGLMKQKLAEGDTDTAMKLAQKAFALRPAHEETQNLLFEMQSDSGDWSGARETIVTKVRKGSLPKDVGRRREAILAMADAKDLLDAGDVEAGKNAAINANKLAPTLIPAAVLAAEMQTLAGNKSAAAKIIKKAWTGNTHPDLAAAFAEIEENETSEQRLKRFNVLTRVNATDTETRLLKAELALADEDFPAARRALADLHETEPTARSLSVMAAIHRGEGAGDEIVRGWLNKALVASRGPQWICSSCNKIHVAWTPKCDNCKAFDSMDWKTPPASDDVEQSTRQLPFVASVLTASDSATDAVVEEAEVVSES